MIFGQIYVFNALLIENIHNKKHPCISINLRSYPPSFTESLHEVGHLLTSMSLLHHQTAKDKLHTLPFRDIDWGLKKSELNHFYDKISQISAPMYEVVAALQPSRHIQMEIGSSLSSLDKIAPRAMSAHLKLARLGNRVAKQIREQSCKAD